MSKSVVPAAAAAHAKHLVSNKKLVKHAGAKQASQDADQASPDHKDEAAQAVQTTDARGHQLSMADAPLGTFSFAGALSDAAGSSASLTSSSMVHDDSDGSMGEERDGSGVVIGVAAAGLAILGGVVAFSGGSKHHNEAPTIADVAAVTTAEDTAKAITVSASDPNGDTLTYATSTPAHGTVSGSNGNYTYTPAANYNGTDSFTVTVTDPKGLTATKTVNITVTPVNDAPTVTATQAVTTDEDTAKTGTVAATDAENNPLTYSVTTSAGHGTATIDATGHFTYTPAANYNGADSFVVSVSDGTATTTQTVNVTVNPVNDAPTFTSAPLSLAGTSGQAITGTVAATDIDAGDVLTYSVTGAAAHGTATVNSSTGAVTYTSTAGFNGTDTFVITVNDGHGGTATQTETVAVGPQITVTSIDVGSPASTVAVTAANGANNFTDDANANTNVRITNFTGGDDTITVTHATTNDYSFANNNGDLEIQFNDGSHNNTIIIVGAAGSSGIFNEATAEAAVGYNFINFA